MKAKLLGIPLVIWGGICILLTIVWVFVWPSDKAAAVDDLQFFILRWFHALTWLFLAAAAFIAAFDILRGAATAKTVAFLALITYLIFVATFVTS